jgi:hypothetical protein
MLGKGVNPANWCECGRGKKEEKKGKKGKKREVPGGVSAG